MEIDNATLQQLAPPELAVYLRKHLKTGSEDSISAHLLSAVKRQSLSPTVISVWLSIARTPVTLLEALTQDFSMYTRRSAIKRLFKLLRKSHWRETWEGVGGTRGLLSLLNGFSVSDVKMCLLLLPKTLNGPDRTEKQANITDLLRGLLPMYFPGAQFTTSDDRPLLHHYQLLLPGCNSKLVDDILHDGRNPLLSDGRFDNKTNSDLLREHYEIVRQQSLEDIFGTTYTAINIHYYLGPLLRYAPGLPTTERGISESMAFSLHVLRELASQPHIKVPLIVITELIEPLLRRARKKKVEYGTIIEILDLAITYLSTHLNEAKNLSFRPNRFLDMCIILWALPSAQGFDFESRLISILRIISYDRNQKVREYRDALLRVQRPLRYSLLKLFFLHIGEKGVDIDEEERLKESSIKNWPCDIFFCVNRDDSVGLLKRLRNTSPLENFLERGSGNSILSHPPFQDVSGADSFILLNLLEAGQDQPGVLKRAAAAVEEQKKKAATSREQVDRAFHAKSALFFAISSGFLELYRDTLVWARRFVRDPLTAKTIFERSANNTSEGITLLSGIPSNLEALQLSDIASRIQVSNQTIFDIFETACSALKEPSFYQPDWAGPIELISDVVCERLSASRRLQDTLHVTDDQFYKLMWSDTLDLLLRIETIGLQTEYEPLQLRAPSGLLTPKYTGRKQELASASLRFIDNLAKARDRLWHGFRPTLDAAVAALPPPLPRGLPVQCLASGFDVLFESAHGLTPFVLSRAEAVVFAEPNKALCPIPEDEDTRSVIGTFVDSFSFALQIYVLQGTSSTIRESRTIRAWEHVLENLSGRMSPAEAHRTWKIYFLRALPKFKMADADPKLNMEYPIFPFGTEVGKYTEWNPAEAFDPPPAAKSRQLNTLTYLDCTLATHSSSRPQVGAKFMEKRLQTVGFEPPSCDIWSLYRMSAKQSRIPAVREGLVVSALLYLEQYIPNHKGILTTPFPSIADVRYPDLWLDLSFAEGKGIGRVGDGEAFQILESLSSTVPPSILHRLVEASLDALFRISAEKDGKVAKLEGVAYRMLCLLAESDRPSLATKSILRIVIERPDSSSWHRKLLSVGFLRSLSTTQAKDLIQSFANSIQQKTKEAAEFSKEAIIATAGSPQKATKPYVKITTIKYLAQLLQGADFVSEIFTVDILSDMFETSTHIDVRAAIVESLMGMLAKCQGDSSDALGDQIVQVLESTIPIAGRLDERYRPEEEDWEEAKGTGKLPAIYEQGSTAFDRCIPPILGAILNPLSAGSLSNRWEEKLFERVIIPILETSTAANTQWLELYTAKHNLDLHSLSLPLLPVKAKFLKQILQRGYRYLPTSLMELYHRFILTNISPPPQVIELNNKIRDQHFIHFPEVKHWLSLYGHGPDIKSYDGFDLIALLRRDWPYLNSSITVTQIQNHIFEHAHLLLSTNQPKAFDNFVSAFSPSSYPGTIDSKDWLKNAQSVLQRIISLIDSQKTPDWQRNNEREPQILPQTLKFKLWLLPYPGADAEEMDISTFANAVRGFIGEICQNGKTYHEELPEIHGAIKRVLPIHQAQVACFLGRLREELSLVDLLCIEVAKALFLTATTPTDERLVEKSRKVVQSWKGCVNEGVRRKGMELSKELFEGKDEFGLFD